MCIRDRGRPLQRDRNPWQEGLAVEKEGRPYKVGRRRAAATPWVQNAHPSRNLLRISPQRLSNTWFDLAYTAAYIRSSGRLERTNWAVVSGHSCEPLDSRLQKWPLHPF